MSEKAFELDEDERAVLTDILTAAEVFQAVDRWAGERASVLARLVARLVMTDSLSTWSPYDSAGDIPRWAIQMLIDHVGFEPAAKVVKEKAWKAPATVKTKGAAKGTPPGVTARRRPMPPATRQKISESLKKQAKKRQRTPGGTFAPRPTAREHSHDGSVS